MKPLNVKFEAFGDYKIVEKTKVRNLFRMAQIHVNEEQFAMMEYTFTKKLINTTDKVGSTALFLACQRGCLRVARYIISLGGDIN